MGLSQNELAKRAGVSLRSIQNYEGREAFPTGKTLRSLCAALEIPISWLMSDSATPVGNFPTPTIDPDSSRKKRDSDGLGRITARLLELTELEFARTEPVILGMIDAVIASRPSPNSDVRRKVEALASERLAKDLEQLGGTPIQSEPRDPAKKPSRRNISPTGEPGQEDSPQ